MAEYHAGLEGLIGLPNPDILATMEFEHTASWYATANFDCWYISGGTTAKREYEYVNREAREVECDNGLRDAGHGGYALDDMISINGKNCVIIENKGSEYHGMTGTLVQDNGDELSEDALAEVAFSHGTLSIGKRFRVKMHKMHHDFYEGYFDGRNLKRNDVAHAAKLQVVEVMALRLYTGPMYSWWVCGFACF